MAMTLQQAPSLPTFNVTVDEIFEVLNNGVNKVEEGVNTVVSAVKPADATYENTITPICHLQNEWDYELARVSLLESAAPSPEIRKAASEAVQLWQRVHKAIFNNERLLGLVMAVKATVKQESLDEEMRRKMTSLDDGFTVAGMKMQGEQRERYDWIRKRQEELRAAFVSNLATDPGHVWKAEEELDGLSKGKLESLEKDGQGRRRVTMHKPDFTAVLRSCHNAQTRKDVYIARENIFPQNAALFKEAILLRDEGARMLGLTSYNHQLVRRRMMKTPDAVMELLNTLDNRLREPANRDIENMKTACGVSGDQPIHAWDFAYYHDKMLQQRNVNHQALSEYFPADFVLAKMLDIFQRIFHLSIVELADKKVEQTWHPDVKVYQVHDLGDNSFVGHLYMDLYPRQGKYNHAADFPVRPSYIDRNGKYVPSGTCLVCNVPAPSKDAPALLQHSDVITVFHELGHGMHDLLGRTKYADFHGWNTARDFGEAPSQLLEHWCWVPQCLQNMSCHYAHLSPQYREHWLRMNPGRMELPPKHIPERAVTDLVAAKGVNAPINAIRQVALSIFDMKVHNPPDHETLEPMDIGAVYNTTKEACTGLKGTDDVKEMGNGHSTTAHYMWGQEANYYSYVSTKMLAADMWKTCFSMDPMSKEAGLRYRNIVLDKGGGADEAGMIRELLGREPNSDAYLADLGV